MVGVGPKGEGNQWKKGNPETQILILVPSLTACDLGPIHVSMDSISLLVKRES